MTLPAAPLSRRWLLSGAGALALGAAASARAQTVPATASAPVAATPQVPLVDPDPNVTWDDSPAAIFALLGSLPYVQFGEGKPDQPFGYIVSAPWCPDCRRHFANKEEQLKRGLTQRFVLLYGRNPEDQAKIATLAVTREADRLGKAFVKGLLPENPPPAALDPLTLTYTDSALYALRAMANLSWVPSLFLPTGAESLTVLDAEKLADELSRFQPPAIASRPVDVAALVQTKALARPESEAPLDLGADRALRLAPSPDSPVIAASRAGRRLASVKVRNEGRDWLAVRVATAIRPKDQAVVLYTEA